MKKMVIKDRLTVSPVQSVEQRHLASTEATAQLKPAIEQEKARRTSQSRPLEVVHYQPGASGEVRQMLSAWHLLFFARTGTTHIQDLRAALQQENEQDVHLMQCFKRVQAQYRQHAAREYQTVSERVASQPVIAEILYGGLTIASGFWLPADMEMGLSLLPSSGARLVLDGFTLVEHCEPDASQSLDVLMIVAPPLRTKAELAALRSTQGDELDISQGKHVITLCGPVAVVAGIIFGAVVTLADAFGATVAAAGEAIVATIAATPPEPPPSEGRIHQQAEGIRDLLGDAPSVSRLLEARRQLLVGDAEPR